MNNLINNKLYYEKNPLLGVVTGIPHSGTTFLSQLIMESIPWVSGAFEVGVLLSDSPKKFHSLNRPFYGWLCGSQSVGHWGLTEEERMHVCDTDEYSVFYKRLAKFYGKSINKNVLQVVDKTPEYVFNIKNILNKINSPIIISHKNIFLQYSSFKKRKHSIDTFKDIYSKYKNSILSVKDNKMVFIIKNEDIVKNQELYLFKALNHFLSNKISVDDIKNMSKTNLFNFKWFGPMKSNYNFDLEL